MDFLASKRIRIGPIVTHQMRLEDVNEAFTLLLDPKHEAVKVVLLPQGEGKGAGNL
jgi:threonine dehydrogenase-like Zn-dependent dehydrogenase